MAERRGIALLCGVILIAGIVWVWLYYGESQNQLIYGIALIIILIGVAYGRYMGGKKILIATALQRSNSEQLRDIRRDPPRLILAEHLGRRALRVAPHRTRAAGSGGGHSAT